MKKSIFIAAFLVAMSALFYEANMNFNEENSKTLFTTLLKKANASGESSTSWDCNDFSVYESTEVCEEEDEYDYQWSHLSGWDCAEDENGGFSEDITCETYSVKDCDGTWTEIYDTCD